MTRSRRDNAYDTRVGAAEIAKARTPVTHVNNAEEYRYRRPNETGPCPDSPSFIANFTKGLPHDTATGLLLNPPDYLQFVKGIHSGDPADFRLTPLGPSTLPAYPCCLSKPSIDCDTTDRSGIWTSQIAQQKNGKDNRPGADVRAWESQGAGLIFDLEGPDSHSVAMPPAPTLDSVELSAEMAEDYLMALLRDVHVSQLRDPGLGDQHEHEPAKDDYCEKCPPKVTVAEALELLTAVKIDGRNWFESGCCDLSDRERARHRGVPDLQHVFRGITPGEDQGPYLSQFLLIGNDALDTNCANVVKPAKPLYQANDGFIAYGSLRVDQRVRAATPCMDYMTTFEAWVDVQNGADMRGCETYVREKPKECGFPNYRSITTPRDIATYVHYDALYEAYLNACLIMMGMGVPFDPGLPFQAPDLRDKQQAFAAFGGPHILTLVPEVATRALKAVRYEKFNVHRRLRPEAVAGLIDRYKTGVAHNGELDPVSKLADALDDAGILERVIEHNSCQNATHADRKHDASGTDRRYLLPMAFPEGSPMHPAYGAGHATVAGACVTILKAYFDHGHELRDKDGNMFAYEPNAEGSGLVALPGLSRALTVEGELNKLAANISIGRNWAGVHYFTDYIESLRMGEQVALGILEEQKLTYGETFTMTVPLFDGGAVQI